MIQRVRIRELLKEENLLAEVTVMGWVRTFRNNQFITLNDGSCNDNLQIVVDSKLMDDNLINKINTGTALCAKGIIIASKGKGQKIELRAINVEILGECDPEHYPIQPKKHSLEFLREIAHLRMRTSTFGSIFRIRHSLAFAVHNFFNDRGFIYIHTPIITGIDAEGAGEMFKVTTLDLKSPPKESNGEINYREDFFGKSTNLTVSGQLEAEAGALALSEVYTFGPTFRAENSNTTRHLAEFWMIEPEMAFCDLTGNMNIAEELLKYTIQYILDNHMLDLEFLQKRLQDEENQKTQSDRSEISLIPKLRFCIENSFERLSYTEAIDILRKSTSYTKNKFKYPVSWGLDLQSEHERYLVEKHFRKPVILTDYPKVIKAFYMRQNDDDKTVRAMDILFPGIGEIIGGSQREERFNKLLLSMKEQHLPLEDLNWYLDTRRFGSCPHSGFGLGFERLVQFVTGMNNIRDVIPFPRTPKNATF